jgi:hypothetical protein
MLSIIISLLLAIIIIFGSISFKATNFISGAPVFMCIPEVTGNYKYLQGSKQAL